MPSSADLPKRLTQAFATLRGTVDTLGAAQLWLDDNRPWRIMVEKGRTHFALAEQYDTSDDRGVPGDGEWTQGKAVCEVVNASIKLASLLNDVSSPANATEGTPAALIGALLSIAIQDPSDPNLDRDWAQKKAMAALRAFLAGKEPEMVRHVTRGYTYLVLGPGRIQTSKPLSDMDDIVQYCGVKGDLWSRPPEEFHDGRFEPAKEATS